MNFDKIKFETSIPVPNGKDSKKSAARLDFLKKFNIGYSFVCGREEGKMLYGAVAYFRKKGDLDKSYTIVLRQINKDQVRVWRKF